MTFTVEAGVRGGGTTGGGVSSNGGSSSSDDSGCGAVAGESGASIVLSLGLLLLLTIGLGALRLRR